MPIRAVRNDLNDISVDNLALLVQKYPSVFERDNNVWNMDQESVGEFYEEKVVQAQNIGVHYLEFFDRWKEMLGAIGAKAFTAKVAWRMVVGMGANAVLETSMTLHHIHGVPYIPGTAVKGILRAYCREINREGDWITRVFGNDPEVSNTSPQKGLVKFMDAYPTQFPKLAMDIMNSHYPDYYRGEKPPADYLEPNPVKFLTVGKDVKFLFAIVCANPDLAMKVLTVLKEAVQNHGVGAKTSVGYGYFRDPNDEQLVGQNQPQRGQVPQQQPEPQIPSYLNADGTLKDEYLIRNRDGKYVFNEDPEIQNKGKKKRQEYEKAEKYFKKHYMTGGFKK